MTNAKDFAVVRLERSGITTFVVVAKTETDLKAAQKDLSVTGVSGMTEARLRRFGGKIVTRDLSLLSARIEASHLRLARNTQR